MSRLLNHEGQECKTGHKKVIRGKEGQVKGQRRVSVVDVLSIRMCIRSTGTCLSHFKKRERKRESKEGDEPNGVHSVHNGNVTTKPPVQ
jgi:hypothetical protein